MNELNISIWDRMGDLCGMLEEKMDRHNLLFGFRDDDLKVSTRRNKEGDIYLEQKNNQLSVAVYEDYILVTLTSGMYVERGQMNSVYVPIVKYHIRFTLAQDGVGLQQFKLVGLREKQLIGKPLSATTVSSELFHSLLRLSITEMRLTLPALKNVQFEDISVNEANRTAGIVKFIQPVCEGKVDFTNEKEYDFNVNEVKEPTHNVKEYMEFHCLDTALVCYASDLSVAREISSSN